MSLLQLALTFWSFVLAAVASIVIAVTDSAFCFASEPIKRKQTHKVSQETNQIIVTLFNALSDDVNIYIAQVTDGRIRFDDRF